MKDKIIEILLSVIIMIMAACLGILWNQHSADHDAQLIMGQQIKVLEAASERDTAQDDRIAKLEKTKTKHWKLHSWARGMIHTMQAKDGVPLSPWPDLDIE